MKKVSIDETVLAQALRLITIYGPNNKDQIKVSKGISEALELPICESCKGKGKVENYYNFCFECGGVGRKL